MAKNNPLLHKVVYYFRDGKTHLEYPCLPLQGAPLGATLVRFG
jgi:hypothetical protein